MHKAKPFGLVVLVVLLLPYTQLVIVKGAGTGYLAIKDYLGKVWTIDDVQKIINTTINTPEGPKSLADYFWIVVDDNPDNKYNLRNFTTSPIDGKTAVLPLTAGDHYIDIYWFGFHQRQLVNIVENTHYILNLETAPVMPFQTAGEPPSSYEWDLVSNPNGLTIQRRDGMAWVRFNYNTSYITVAWYDDNTGWNYQSMDVYIDTSYQYLFHVTDPANPEYYEEKTGSFLWLTWDVYKIEEQVKWNRTGEILHVSYIVAIAENQALLNGINEFWASVAEHIVALGTKFVDPITSTIYDVKGWVDFVQSAYDTYMGELYASKYQQTVLLVWDVFATPTLIIVLAHAYDIQSDGTVVKKPITSANAFTINNRLVYIKQLGGGIQYNYDLISYSTLKNFAAISPPSTEAVIIYTNYTNGYIKRDAPYTDEIYALGGKYSIYNLDDLAKYNYMQWLSMKVTVSVPSDASNYVTVELKLNMSLIITFSDSGRADDFEQNLLNNNIQYCRNNNTFTIYRIDNKLINVTQGATDILNYLGIEDYTNIIEYIPSGSRGSIYFDIYCEILGSGNGYTAIGVSLNITMHWIRFIIPKLQPPQISLLKDGYAIVNGAFAVQVYTDLFREDQDAYVLGYYLLGNQPPPSYIIRDVYYDIDNDVIHYVFTIISADCYGQDIVDMVSNTTLNENNETIHNYYLSIKPTIRTFDNVTLALFNLNKMSFLNLAPEIIQYLLAVPPSQGGYGTPVIDWSTISVMTVNMTRPYELYYWDKPSATWIRVNITFYNDTLVYDIIRYADNVLVEKLYPGNMSQYYYKLIYTDTNETYKGWLLNKNGTLVMIIGQVTWSLTPEELQQLLASIQLQGILDQWNQAWQNIAEQLGLIQETLNSIAGTITGAWDWLYRNRFLLLGGFLGFIVLLVLLMTASRPRIVIAGGYRRR